MTDSAEVVEREGSVRSDAEADSGDLAHGW